jgi:hypothetical protein
LSSPTQLLDIYRATSYDVRLPGGARTSLRIGKPVPEALRLWVRRDWPLLFISACNPHSKQLAADDNRDRSRTLLDRLDRSHLRRLVGVGRATDRAWREASFLVAGLSLEAADRLAVEFGQNAIVVAINPVSTRLRVYRNEWRTRIDNDADIMWTGR